MGYFLNVKRPGKLNAKLFALEAFLSKNNIVVNGNNLIITIEGRRLALLEPESRESITQFPGTDPFIKLLDRKGA